MTLDKSPKDLSVLACGMVPILLGWFGTQLAFIKSQFVVVGLLYRRLRQFFGEALLFHSTHEGSGGKQGGLDPSQVVDNLERRKSYVTSVTRCL